MKLKKCECGGTPEYITYHGELDECFIYCTVCGIATPKCDDEIEAQHNWNKRHCNAVFWTVSEKGPVYIS